MTRPKTLSLLLSTALAGCSMTGDQPLETPTGPPTQADSPANVTLSSAKPIDPIGGYQPAVTPAISGNGPDEAWIARGDWDGDGIDDMALLSPYWCIRVVYGSKTWPRKVNLDDGPTLRGDPHVAMDCGSSTWVNDSAQQLVVDDMAISAAGDVDRDGYADLLVSVRGTRFGGSSPASPYLVSLTHIVYGGPTRINGNRVLPDMATATFQGMSSAIGVGDVNGDGYADIAGIDQESPRSDIHVLVFYGGARRFQGSIGSDRADVTLLGPTSRATNTLMTLIPAGDMTGDGYADLLVKATELNPNQTAAPNTPWVPDTVGIWLVPGGSGLQGLSSISGAPWLEGPVVQYVQVYSMPGDLDGDGRSDLVIHSHPRSTYPSPDDLNIDTNIIYGGPDTTPRTSLGDATFSGLYRVVAADVDGDGTAELVIGTPGTGDETGAVYIQRTSQSRLSGPVTPAAGAMKISSPAEQFWSGNLVFPGDWDHDGLADLLVGPGGNSAYLLRGAALSPGLLR